MGASPRDTSRARPLVCRADSIRTTSCRYCVDTRHHDRIGLAGDRQPPMSFDSTTCSTAGFASTFCAVVVERGGGHSDTSAVDLQSGKTTFLRRTSYIYRDSSEEQTSRLTRDAESTAAALIGRSHGARRGTCVVMCWSIALSGNLWRMLRPCSSLYLHVASTSSPSSTTSIATSSSSMPPSQPRRPWMGKSPAASSALLKVRLDRLGGALVDEPLEETSMAPRLLVVPPLMPLMPLMPLL